MSQPEPKRTLRQDDRTAITERIVRLVSDWGGGRAEELHAQIAPRIDALDSKRFEELIERFRITGTDWEYYPADPFARELSRRVMGQVLLEGSRVHGAERLAEARSRRVLLVGNHLSYVDVNVFDHLNERAGYGDLMDRLAVVVGPKVYTAPIRLLASLCFGTIKTPQSSHIASGEAVMSAREVATLARRTLDLARQRVERGDLLLLFPEGSRSRSGSLQPLLPGAARYLEIPDLWILPFAHTGCERLVPLEEDHVYPARVDVRIGAPVRAASLLEHTGGSRRLCMDVLGLWIAALLPEAYRGHYAAPDAARLGRAPEIAAQLQEDVRGPGA